MSPTPDSTLPDPQQIIADLRRELDECRVERDKAQRKLDECRAERDEGHELLAPIYDWFTEGFDTPDLKEARELLSELA